MEINEKQLEQFIGTEHYYAGYMGVNYTDGVKFLMENGAAWLVTDISSYQADVKIKAIPFQLWILKVNDDKTAVLTMHEDSNLPNLVEQKYNYTDFPLKELKLYLIDGVLLLTSEY